RMDLGAGLEILEVALVQHHAVHLVAGPALELGPVARAALHAGNLGEQLVAVLDIALVELPVLVDLLVGDTLEPAGLEGAAYLERHHDPPKRASRRRCGRGQGARGWRGSC